jgi:RHS repeat-associated protein
MAPKNGFVYVYVSNESNYNVYFDNLQVSLTHGPIAEDNAYYPFGLSMAGISDKAVKWNLPENKMRFGGKELQNREFSDGTGLDAYDFGARWYDPQIGRWQQQDPMAEYMRRWTPYAYAFDNPLRFSDGNGMLPGDDSTKKPTPPPAPDPDEPTGHMKDAKVLDPVVVTPHKSIGAKVGGFLWGMLDYVPFVGSIKQIGEGIAHGSWAEAGMGVLALGVDVFTGGEGGEGLRLAEKGVQILAEDEVKEVAEKALAENIAKGSEEEIVETSVAELRQAGESDAHHIIQDASVRDLPGYSTSKAPGVKLEGPSWKQGTPHYNATQVQRSSGLRRGTYARERVIGYKALKAAGIPKDAAKQYIRSADKYFQSIGVNMKTVTRVPG